MPLFDAELDSDFRALNFRYFHCNLRPELPLPETQTQNLTVEFSYEMSFGIIHISQ